MKTVTEYDSKRCNTKQELRKGYKTERPENKIKIKMQKKAYNQ